MYDEKIGLYLAVEEDRLDFFKKLVEKITSEYEDNYDLDVMAAHLREALKSEAFKERLRDNIQQSLKSVSRITLAELLERYPLKFGFQEIVSYALLDGEGFVDEVVEDDVVDSVEYEDQGKFYKSDVPKIIFIRE